MEKQLEDSEKEKREILAKLNKAKNEETSNNLIIEELKNQAEAETKRLMKEKGKVQVLTKSKEKLEDDIANLKKCHNAETKKLQLVIATFEDEMKDEELREMEVNNLSL